MSRLHLLLLPDEILLRIIGFLDVRDLCSLMCCCHALRQFSCDDSIWSTLVKELLDDGTVATSVRPLLSIDSHTAALPPRELFKGQWRKVFAQLLVRAEEEFRSVDYSSILVADPASQTREAGAGAREAAVLLEALLVGCSDAEMPHFFYNSSLEDQRQDVSTQVPPRLQPHGLEALRQGHNCMHWLPREIHEFVGAQLRS